MLIVVARPADEQRENGAEYPDKFRIGPPKHEFTYSQLQKGLFRCCRASDQGKSSTLRLYLYFSLQGYWVAADAPLDVSSIREVVDQGVPIFRSSANVLVADWHTWETNWNAHESTEEDWRATGLSCFTSIL